MRALFFMGVCIVWGGAVAFKGLLAVRTGEPYVFSVWDGGILRVGKHLSPLGARIKIGVGVSMALAALLLVTGIVPFMVGGGVVIAAALVSVGSDFVHASDPSYDDDDRL